mmetsp:Transcript_28711/g.71126  ORF Transcript_28711/g.71126 Transcript_28711/m.71126 type:complete len:267 (-) Transcript_28711:303-1103(-)
MPAMHKQELRAAVLGVLDHLVIPDPAHVPDADPPVLAARAKQRLKLGRPLHLDHLIRVPVERVELGREVPHVPQRHCLVGRPRCYQVLVERVEVQAVDLGRMRVHLLHGLLVRRLLVPHKQHLVVADRAEDVRLRVVPRHILHHVGVALVDHNRVHGLRVGVRGLHVPHADVPVVRPAQKPPRFVRAPREPVPLLVVPAQLHVRRGGSAVCVGLGPVLGVVEDKHVHGGRLGRDDVGVLGHEARPVHLPLVHDPVHDLDPRRGRLA